MRWNKPLAAVLLCASAIAMPQLSEKPRITSQPAMRVDLNSASMEELLQVPGMTRTWASRIVRFRPSDGAVMGWIDASGLLTADDQREPVDVLNGIAYDAAGKRLFVTGKLWPKLFEVQLVGR